MRQLPKILGNLLVGFRRRNPQTSASDKIAVAESQGIAARPSSCANGPSVSVNIRFRGIREAKARPLSPESIAGPTLNQQPRSIACANSDCVPENQCRMGVPAPGYCAKVQRTAGPRAGYGS
jgi:hypothetical protein